MSGANAGARMIRCPACGGPSVYAPDNAFRPFCSARCKNNDLGAWASEGYRVGAEPDPDNHELPGGGVPPETLPH